MSKHLYLIAFDADGERNGRVELDRYDGNTNEFFIEVYDESHGNGKVESAVVILTRESVGQLADLLLEIVE